MSKYTAHALLPWKCSGLTLSGDEIVQLSAPVEGEFLRDTLTALLLVSRYDEVGHDVEDCKQEEADLKRQRQESWSRIV